MSTRLRTKLVTPCTAGSRKIRSGFRITSIRFFWRRSHRHSTKNSSPHHLLKTTSDPKMRAYIINRQIDDLRGTLFRQTMFAEFEKIIHAIEESGDALTLDVFRSQYRGLLEAYFAENFVLDAELDLECLRIPHFYHAFYVYKYATGISAAVALSAARACRRVGERGGIPWFSPFRRLEISAGNIESGRRGHDHIGADREHVAFV